MSAIGWAGRRGSAGAGARVETGLARADGRIRCSHAPLKRGAMVRRVWAAYWEGQPRHPPNDGAPPPRPSSCFPPTRPVAAHLLVEVVPQPDGAVVAAGGGGVVDGRKVEPRNPARVEVHHRRARLCRRRVRIERHLVDGALRVLHHPVVFSLEHGLDARDLAPRLLVAQVDLPERVELEDRHVVRDLRPLNCRQRPPPHVAVAAGRDDLLPVEHDDRQRAVVAEDAAGPRNLALD